MPRHAPTRRASKLTTRRAAATLQHTALNVDLCPDLSPARCQFYATAGDHAGQHRTQTCSAAVHVDCLGFIAAHDARAASPQICRHYIGARCAYGAHAADRLPSAPPAIDELKERQLLHAHCVPNTTRWDDFEHDPASALLLTHNTNLGSFPALQRLSDPGLRARPLEFDSVINECKVEINTRSATSLRRARSSSTTHLITGRRSVTVECRAACAGVRIELKPELTLAVHVGSLVDHFTGTLRTTVTGKRDPHTQLPRLCQLVRWERNTRKPIFELPDAQV